MRKALVVWMRYDLETADGEGIRGEIMSPINAIPKVASSGNIK